MAKQTINLGTGELTGDGESIRSAFDKINDNFDELYIRDLNTDAQTLTLVGDTLSISGGNSVTITHPTIPTALSDLTSDLDNLNAGENIPDLLTAYTDQSAVVDALLNAEDWGGGLVAPSDYTYYDLVVQRRAVNPFIPQELEDEALAQLNAYNAWQAEIAADKATITVGDYAWNFKGDGVLSFPDGTTQTTAWTGITDLTGSVFADDSTLLVDGVNSKINLQNTVLNNTISTSDEVLYLNTAGTPGQRGFKVSTTDSIFDIYGATLTDGNGGGLWLSGGIPEVGMQQGDVIISGHIVSILAGDGNGGGGIAFGGPVIGTTSMDISGSVFADDSSLLVDGVNGTIPGYISLADLKTEVAASTDFEDFKTRIAAL